MEEVVQGTWLPEAAHSVNRVCGIAERLEGFLWPQASCLIEHGLIGVDRAEWSMARAPGWIVAPLDVSSWGQDQRGVVDQTTSKKGFHADRFVSRCARIAQELLITNIGTV